MIKLATIKTDEIICWLYYKKWVCILPISAKIIKKWSVDHVVDMWEPMITFIKNSGRFTLKLEATTEVSDDSQLIFYVRYWGLERIEDEMLVCSSLKLHIRRIDIFEKVHPPFKSPGSNFGKEELHWFADGRLCKSLCCFRWQRQPKKVQHCIIHQYVENMFWY